MSWFKEDPWSEVYTRESPAYSPLADLFGVCPRQAEQPRRTRPQQNQNQNQNQQRAQKRGPDRAADSLEDSLANAILKHLRSQTQEGGDSVESEHSSEDTQWYPKADLLESPTSYQIRVDLPGIKKEDVAVEVDPGGTLTVSGTKPTPTTTMPTTQWHHTERRFGKFSRSFRVPVDGVDQSSISATFDLGVLTLVVPKPVSSPKQHRISIL
ncbi:hypothetical protein Pelo_14615 [Pelomyxa schiedti]|nr:hypothetical protein Pelo_14615 [Pelomyxa schiedti]